MERYHYGGRIYTTGKDDPFVRDSIAKSTSVDGKTYYYRKYKGEWYFSNTVVTIRVDCSPWDLKGMPKATVNEDGIPIGYEKPKKILLWSKKYRRKIPKSTVRDLNLEGDQEPSFSMPEFVIDGLDFVSPHMSLRDYEKSMREGKSSFDAIADQKEQIALNLALGAVGGTVLGKLAGRLGKYLPAGTKGLSRDPISYEVSEPEVLRVGCGLVSFLGVGFGVV